MKSARTNHQEQVLKRTIPDSRYYTPTVEEIEEQLKLLGVPDNFPVPIDIVQDLCNVQSFEYFERDKNDAFVDQKFWPRVNSDEVKYHKNVQEFLKEIKYDSYPGTPLERACLIAAHLAAQEENGSGKGNPKEDKDANGNQKMECFTPGPKRGDPREMAGKMAEMAEKLKHISDFEQEALEFNNCNDFQKLVKLSQGATKLLTSISLKLEGFKKISVSAKKTRVVDTHSRKKRHVKIRDFNKINKVSKIKFVDPAFDHKLATKNLYHKEGFVVNTEKQLLMMLIDDSGSMSSPLKLAWRNAVLLNRCEAVSRGDAELIVYFYEVGRYRRTHVKTKEEAMALYQRVLHHRPGGGGTNIAGVLQESIKEIHGMHGYKPDIMIVLDGQDHFTDMDHKGVIVHAVIIGTQHKQLEKFCKKTGGMFLYEEER